jgi:hypothetical protein
MIQVDADLTEVRPILLHFDILIVSSERILLFVKIRQIIFRGI